MHKFNCQIVRRQFWPRAIRKGNHYKVFKNLSKCSRGCIGKIQVGRFLRGRGYWDILSSSKGFIIKSKYIVIME